MAKPDDADRWLDPDFRRLRDEHERELDAHYPHWLASRGARFPEDFERWREQRSAGTRYDSGNATPARM